MKSDVVSDLTPRPGSLVERDQLPLMVEAVSTKLAEATTVREVMVARADAKGWEQVLKAAQANDEANRFTELRLRAERKVGDMLINDPEFGRGRKSITVDHFGISHKQSERWQNESRIEESVFEDYVTACKDNSEPITTTGLLQFAARLATKPAKNQQQAIEDIWKRANQVLDFIDSIDPELYAGWHLNQGKKSQLRRRAARLRRWLEKLESKL